MRSPQRLGMFLALASCFTLAAYLWWQPGQKEEGQLQPQLQQQQQQKEQQPPPPQQDPDTCLEGCDQADERLVNLIKTKYLNPPSTLPYNFENEASNIHGQYGQPEVIDELLQQKRDGFFIECGACDGEGFSNTLFFEKERNWTGLLIEADPLFKLKPRRAFSLRACLALEGKSGAKEYLSSGMLAGLAEAPESQSMKNRRKQENTKSVTVQCFPLYSVLLAMGNPVVDFFSLDVEGAEMPILRSLPWDKVRVRVWMIEYNGEGALRTEMVDFMTSKGYELTKDLHGQDLIFMKDI